MNRSSELFALQVRLYEADDELLDLGLESPRESGHTGNSLDVDVQFPVENDAGAILGEERVPAGAADLLLEGRDPEAPVHMRTGIIDRMILPLEHLRLHHLLGHARDAVLGLPDVEDERPLVPFLAADHLDLADVRDVGSHLRKPIPVGSVHLRQRETDSTLGADLHGGLPSVRRRTGPGRATQGVLCAPPR